jgi:hydroxypyruvate reductase
VDLRRLLDRVLAACDPAAATARALAALGLDRPAWIAAVGKAAPAMAVGARDRLDVRGALVVAPDGTDARGLDVVRAAHPVPDARSEAAGRALLAFARAVPPGDVMVALVSGGASALAAVPRAGLSLAEKVARVQALAASGAPIAELNRLRASLSAIKGGRLAAACPGRVVTVVVSDVVGDDPAVVGSGPTVPCDTVVVASGVADLARAAAAVTGGAVVDAALTGDVEEVAGRVAAAIRDGAGWMIWAGEPTVRLPPRPGRGGRARQQALLVARALAGVPGWRLLVAGSDGVDGTGDAAGAIVDGATWGRLTDPQGALDRCDAGGALGAIGAEVVTGPTGVNHADLLVAFRYP